MKWQHYFTILAILTTSPLLLPVYGADNQPVHTLYPHLESSMMQQVATAQGCIKKWNSRPEDRMAAVYLHAHLMATWRDKLVACSIQYLVKNMLPYTPLDIYVFAHAQMYDQVVETMKQHLGDKADSVCVLPIPEIQWQHHKPRVTPYLLPNNTNRFQHYLFMGQWRLLVPFNIMHHLGYPYVLQLDDDLFLPEPFKVNALTYMREQGKKLATHRVASEAWQIMQGLPEMAKFFLESNDLQPGSTLLKHVYPQDQMTSLYSPHHRWSDPESPHLGYDLSVLWGNFLIMSTELWADTKVQDWIALCMTSGGMERHRWQEQGIMAFVWLLFTDEDELWRLEPPEFEYVHGRKPPQRESMCSHLGFKNGMIPMSR